MKNCSNRFGVSLAAATVALLVGSHGLRAQDQTGLFADADGIAPPDMGIAYEIPASSVAAVQYPLWPELTALLADPDGMNASNMGFAYDLPVPVNSFAAQQASDPATQALLFDADGLEPPDIGIAYEIVPAVKFVAERPVGTAQ